MSAYPRTREARTSQVVASVCTHAIVPSNCNDPNLRAKPTITTRMVDTCIARSDPIRKLNGMDEIRCGRASLSRLLADSGLEEMQIVILFIFCIRFCSLEALLACDVCSIERSTFRFYTQVNRSEFLVYF